MHRLLDRDRSLSPSLQLIDHFARIPCHGNGSEVAMRLPDRSYRAPYQAAPVDHVFELVKASDVPAAWRVVNDAIPPADSVECPWCGRLGPQEDRWIPRTGDSV